MYDTVAREENHVQIDGGVSYWSHIEDGTISTPMVPSHLSY